jgi:hypothetical protein
MLSEIVIQKNWNALLEIVETQFPDRAYSLLPMYKELEERMVIMPASSNENHHNAFPGGYVDHILRVYECATKLYDVWKHMGADVSGFSIEELKFAAIHHDLGKAGHPGTGNEKYKYNDSEWHRKNLGKIYKHNTHIPYASTPDMSLYLLQYYNVAVTWNEYLAIKVHDGVYDESNKQYFMPYNTDYKFKSCLPLIIHHADSMAASIEYDSWKLNAKPAISSTGVTVKSPLKKIITPIADGNLSKAFDSIFE